MYNKTMRDSKAITEAIAKQQRASKEKLLFKNLRTEVNTGASGTQKYVIKSGPNAGKVAEGFQKTSS
jgi:hypothetical protein|tara:strand:+ start:251 stop:451 length:201 start_codon:yes stop_codon:yes gene_type:complete